MAGEITFTVSEKDYADANRDWFLGNLKRPRPWIAFGLLALVSAGVGGGSAWLDGKTEEAGSMAAGFALLGLLVALLVCLATYLALPRRTRRLYRQHKILHQPCTIGWTEAGLSIDSANGRTLHPWPDFHRRLVGRRAVLLFLNDQLFFILPRRLLDDTAVEDIESLAAAEAMP